ncbi:MAG: hypothetical protein WCP29_14870 [Acidobacteriota bacterium]
MKKRNTTTWLLVAMAWFLVPGVAHAQLPPAASLLPPGFTLEAERSFGPATTITAVKPNENVPKPHQEYKIQLTIGSNGMPGTERNVEMLFAVPEEPAKQDPGSVSRSEPCGKHRYRGGVLTCRKQITPWVGTGKAPDLVMLTVNWVVATPSGLVAIGVANFVGARETAVGWIDSIADKIAPTGKKH